MLNRNLSSEQGLIKTDPQNNWAEMFQKFR